VGGSIARRSVEAEFVACSRDDCSDETTRLARPIARRFAVATIFVARPIARRSVATIFVAHTSASVADEAVSVAHSRDNRTNQAGFLARSRDRES
jgi:hypothetical protein